MLVDVYNKENKKVDSFDLDEKLFKIEWRPDLVHEVLVAQLANRRQKLAHTKNRGEVRGGGRKPWRQKGTGRARHGSLRSPLFVGGGVVFGPRKEKDYSKKVNKKVKRLALLSLISKKLADGYLKIIDDLNLEERKTKKVEEILKNFFEKPKSILFVLSLNNKTFALAARNLPKIYCLKPNNLDVYSLLSYRYLFFEKAAVEELGKIYKKS